MTGRAHNYAVVGQPVAHSLSPMIHTHFAGQTRGLDVRYGHIEMSPADFESECTRFFAAGGKGLNVTAPHKAAALELCDEVSEEARMAGAVNTIAIGSDGKLRGYNTDGPGLVCDLQDHLGVTLHGSHILLLGAGGASRGVTAPLLAAQPASLTIANRTAQTAIDGARDFAGLGNIRGCGLDTIGDARFDLVINATAASLHGGAPAIDGRYLKDAVCYDMTYAAGGTPFTDFARLCGASAVHTGIGMLVEQAALSFEIWHGLKPATKSVRRMLADDQGFDV